LSFEEFIEHIEGFHSFKEHPMFPKVSESSVEMPLVFLNFKILIQVFDLTLL